MEKSLFEKIADREIPANIIWENDTHIAFLDIMPLTKGQTLVVPKKNISDELFEMDSKDYQDLMMATKHVAEIIKEKLDASRVLMIVEGLEVSHVHIKLLPTNGQEIATMQRYKASEEELVEIKSQIKSK